MTQVFIAEGEAFLFEPSAAVTQVADSWVYRRGVLPWTRGPCIDFVIRADDEVCLLAVQRLDRPARSARNRPVGLRALPELCGAKALGALALIGRWGLRDIRGYFDEMEWERGLVAVAEREASFGLYVRSPALPDDDARSGAWGARARRGLAHLRRQIARTTAVGWLTGDVRLVQLDGLESIPGLCAVEPAPRLWTHAARDAFVEAIAGSPAFGAGVGGGGIRRSLHALRGVLPADWSARMPDLGDLHAPLSDRHARLYLRGELDWLDADHADRRIPSGQPGLIPWAHAAVDRLLGGDATWHRWIGGPRGLPSDVERGGDVGGL